MSARTVMVMALAGVMGVGTAVAVREYVGQMGPDRPKEEMLRVVVAIRELPRGTALTNADIEYKEIPIADVPENAMTETEEAVDRTSLVRVGRHSILVKGELSPKGQTGMEAQILPGMRAFTILTPTVASGVAGFVVPGNKVDVLLTLGGSIYASRSGLSHSGDSFGPGVTMTLLYNIEILAVDQRLDRPSEMKVDPKELQSVTLLVTPEQASKLTLSQNKGVLQLALRNPTDGEAVSTAPITLADLPFDLDMMLTSMGRQPVVTPPVQPVEQVTQKIPVSEPVSEEVSEEDSGPVSVQAPSLPPEPLQIRTLRGTYNGVVLVTPPLPPRHETVGKR